VLVLFELTADRQTETRRLILTHRHDRTGHSLVNQTQTRRVQ